MAKKKSTKAKVTRKTSKKKTAKKKVATRKNGRATFSKSATRKVIKLLRKEGKMSVAEVAKALGKSAATVYNMAAGRVCLSAQDYGKLLPEISKSVSKSVVNAVEAITMDDVRRTAKKVQTRAKELSKTAAKKGVSASQEGAKFAAREVGAFLNAAGNLLKGLGS